MNDFRGMADERLKDLTFQPLVEKTAQAARRMSRPVKTRKTRLAVALALVLLALCATALAVGLRWSRQMNAANAGRAAVMQKYGLTADTLSLFEERVQPVNDGWRVVYSTQMQEVSEKAGSYTATVSSSGKAEASWSYDGVDPALWQDGALTDPYWGAKQLQSWKQRQDEAIHASMNKELPYNAYPAILEADGVQIADESMRQPVLQANQALRQAYGISPEALTLFTASAYIDETTGLWTVRYTPKHQERWGEVLNQWVECEQKMGEYQVVLTNDSQGNRCSWSLDGVENGAFTEHTYAGAKAFDAAILEYLLHTIQRRAEIVGRYVTKNAYGWDIPAGDQPVSVEDNAALDAILLDAGFDSPSLNHVLPQPGDISREQAVEIFYQAVHQQYGVERDVFENSGYAYAELTQEPECRQWYFWLQSNQALASWSVSINAQTGEILWLTCDASAGSNG